LFSSFRYDSTDVRLPEAAYWATYSAYGLKDPVLTLRYHKLALKDTAKASFTLMYIAEAHRWLKDRELYLQTLEKGFQRYPTFHYFFPRLMDEYNRMGQYEKALATADSAISVNDSSLLFLFAKSTTLLHMERWADCVIYSERLIQLCDTIAEPYFNAGTCYLNMAEKLDAKKDKKLRKQAFQRAQTYMERYRQLAPNERDKWATALYRIYLNLNMGRQFDEIDRLLRK
jgi:tetratricopeptide (TPR) repeat protein